MSETATGRLLDAYVSPLGDEYRAIPRGEEGMGAEEPVSVETQQSLLSVKEGETFVCSDLVQLKNVMRALQKVQGVVAVERA